MLVLTRKQGQSIVIGDSIEVFIVEVRGDQVRLGIRAPRSVSVLRREVMEQISSENREAAQLDPESLRDFTGIVVSGEGPRPNTTGDAENDS